MFSVILSLWVWHDLTQIMHLTSTQQPFSLLLQHKLHTMDMQILLSSVWFAMNSLKTDIQPNSDPIDIEFNRKIGLRKTLLADIYWYVKTNSVHFCFDVFPNKFMCTSHRQIKTVYFILELTAVQSAHVLCTFETFKKLCNSITSEEYSTTEATSDITLSVSREH